MSKIRIRAREQDGVVDFRALIDHPMEGGFREDADGNPVPAHHITDVTLEHNGAVIMRAEWGGSVSRNPYLAVKFKGSQGDTVRLHWRDNLGEEAQAEAEVR